MNSDSLRRSPITKTKSAFTLLEVMIAVGVLFMCLFAVLALTANSLASARKLQQHQAIDTGSFAGLYYVQLANTNSITEGDDDVDVDDIFPGYKCRVYKEEVGTNGLWDVEYRVTDPKRQAEIHGHFLVYNANAKSGLSHGNLPRH